MANGMSHFFSDLQNWLLVPAQVNVLIFVFFFPTYPPLFFDRFLLSFLFMFASSLPVCNVWHVFGERSRGTRNRGSPHSHILQTHCGAPGRSLIMKLGRRYWLGVSWLRWRGQNRGSSGPCQWNFNIFPLLSLNLHACVIQQWVILCKRE